MCDKEEDDVVEVVGDADECDVAPLAAVDSDEESELVRERDAMSANWSAKAASCEAASISPLDCRCAAC